MRIRKWGQILSSTVLKGSLIVGTIEAIRL
jgi:hypothetical protein